MISNAAANAANAVQACCAPDASAAECTSAMQPIAVNAADEQLAQLARAIAHPIRVAIIRFLSQIGQCFCGDLVACLQQPQSSVSQHLKVLKQAGLISGTTAGRQVCYGLNQDGIRLLRTLTAQL